MQAEWDLSYTDLTTLATVLKKASSIPRAKLPKAKLESLFDCETSQQCGAILLQSGFVQEDDAFVLVDKIILSYSLNSITNYLASNIPFPLVCQLVQEGSQVPGIANVDPFPTTELSLTRSEPPRKPWERT